MLVVLLAATLVAAGPAPREFVGPTAVPAAEPAATTTAPAAPTTSTPLEPVTDPVPAPALPPPSSPPPRLPKIDGVGIIILGGALVTGGVLTMGLGCCSHTGFEFFIGGPLAGIGAHLLALGIILKVRHTRIKRRLKSLQAPPRAAWNLHPFITDHGGGLGLTLRHGGRTR